MQLSRPRPGKALGPETKTIKQGDHSPYNVKFPDGSRHSSAALSMLSFTRITPVLVLNTYMDANMQLIINSFRQLLPNISQIFSKIPDISLTAVKFPDISRFSRQVVTAIKIWP